MLSILIPNYNFDATKLIIDLHKLAFQEKLVFEIILGEDGTSDEIYQHHKTLLDIGHFSILREEKTTGRACIRNNLARKAIYDWLLFIDSDAMLTNIFSLKFYFESIKRGEVICGGTCYAKETPELISGKLRWAYGRAREETSAEDRNSNPFASFSTFNFLIKKEVFLSVLFDESLSQYGHEDTLFGYRLKEKNIPVIHIENQLIHTGLDENRVFIDKTRQGLRNLALLTQKLNFKPDFIQLVALLKMYTKLKYLRLIPLFVAGFKLSEKWMFLRLTGKRPSVRLFQLYKLGYFCSLLHLQNK